ncbi:N-acyl homoserine lactonase family protein [Chloroflexota bacterium]
MPTYSICPIPLCEGPRQGSHFTAQMNFDCTYQMICYSWYIKGSQPKVLVDPGAPASLFTEIQGIKEQKDIMSIEDGLAKLGVKPEEIEIVIVTHLHNDHIMQGHLFKNARFIVQKKELEYAENPHPLDGHHFDRKNWEGLNLEVIDGSKEIIDGISVFLSPGHTPGGQSVEVSTEKGKAIITGFCCSLATFQQTERMKNLGWEVAIPNIHLDAVALYNSILDVKRRADIVVAQHDNSYRDRCIP